MEDRLTLHAANNFLGEVSELNPLKSERVGHGELPSWQGPASGPTVGSEEKLIA